METMFIHIMEMSIASCFIILAVIGMRFLLKKAPKGFCYVLWALVAIRLICPVTIESSFSLVPQMDTVLEDVQGELTGEQNAPNQNLQNSTTDVINLQGNIIGNQNVQNSTTDVENPQGSAVGNQNLHNSTTDVENPQGSAVGNQNLHNSTTDVENSQGSTVGNQNLQNNITDAEKLQNSTPGSEKSSTSFAGVSYVWLTVVVLLLVYMIASYIYLWKKVQVSAPIGDNVYICDAIRSPFIFGVIRPRIYLPSYVEKEQMSYILAHEKAHMKCLDYLWKPLGFAILSIHWFNPLVWMAYVLMCKDLELACDERVIRHMDLEEKRNYSEVLLACSSPRHYISACPVAFGEISIKERIKKVLLYKKPATWVIGIAVLVCLIIGVCFLTNPKGKSVSGDIETEMEQGTETQEETETESQKEEDSNIQEDEPLFTYKQGDAHEFSITLPDGVKLGEKKVTDEIEAWVLEMETYNPLEKYPYANEDDIWITPGFVTSFEGPYIKEAETGYRRSIEDWDCITSDFENYLGLKICTVEADVYSYEVWANDDELSYDSGYIYYWMLLFDDNTGSEFRGKTNCVLLNQKCFTKAEALSIGLRFVPDFKEDTTVEQDKTLQDGYKETVIYETTADLNHDGLPDKVQTVVIYSSNGNADVTAPENAARIKIFCQKQDGTYDNTPTYVTDTYSYSHSANETAVLTQKDGKDYLMFSEMYQMQEEAIYYFDVWYLGSDNVEVVVAADEIEFACGEYSDLWYDYHVSLRDEVVPAFKAQMENWIANGKILISYDVSTSVYVSTQAISYAANVYYDQIWSRRDRADLPEGTSYKVAYQAIAEQFVQKYPEKDHSARFDLIYFDEDETPELLVSVGTDTSIYTYHNGRIYPIIKEWGFGAGGNAGYFYIPKKNVLYNENADYAGAINYIHLWKIDENHQLSSYYDESLVITVFDSLDWSTAPNPEELDGKAHFFYGDKQVTEDEFNTYLMGYTTVDEIKHFGYGKFIFLEADKKMEELIAEW